MDETESRIRTYFREEVKLADGEAQARTVDILRIFALPDIRPIARAVVEHWWLFGVRGLLAIAFGVLTLFAPRLAIAALVLFFGAWALVDGISALVMAFSGRHRSWQLLVMGLLGIAAGVLTFMRPDLTAVGLYALIAAWSIARGIVEIAFAVALRREIRGEGWLIVAGLFSILFGVLLIALPVAGVLAVLWLISFYALLFGGLLIGLALRMRALRNRVADRTLHLPGTPQPA
jgi:uncharacterized membrane protein HdeD (DUF308 family)